MDPVTAAFDATPRRDFLPRGVRRRASYDGPLAIAAGQTNSQPRTVDDMLRLLDVRAGQRVLDVGSGAGGRPRCWRTWSGRPGRCSGVELEPELVSFGAGNLARTDRPWASIRPAEPGVLGDADGAPYDRILVSADGRRAAASPWSTSSPTTACW